jgi:hypothetical protein
MRPEQSFLMRGGLDAADRALRARLLNQLQAINKRLNEREVRESPTPGVPKPQ